MKIIFLLAFALLLLFESAAQVKVYEEKETIPTYRLGPDEPSPLFYTGRNVQGAAGHYYPYPAQITLGDKLTDVTYDMVYLENEYIKITILPALGGKLFSAIDKTNGHEIFHRNSTVKPDLIGTLGAWISGGIEWCFPHHHRTTTFLPSDYLIRENEDGSATVWVGETERSLHLRGVIGITLHPGRSYIDVVYRLNNPNPVIKNFKFWANVAVTADSNFRTFFPPSQEIGVFHNNSSYTHWPVSHEIYKGTDYTKGVDMTWYKNHPSPVSVFFWEGEEGFIGGYDYAAKAGMVHVGDKYVNRTSKLWEWGPGLEGENARRKLTDDGRDYVELMTGSWSNNQPDYSWFSPYTVKETRNFWYPVRDLEIAKNATEDAAVTLQLKDPVTVFYGFNVTGRFPNSKIMLKYDNQVVAEKLTDLDPSKPFTAYWKSPSEIDEDKLSLSLQDENGKTLVSYTPYQPKNPPLPEVFKDPLPAQEIESLEDLYLAGRFIEQFSRPYQDAEAYYLEALRRSPDDYRVNIAMGIRKINQWKYSEAENYLRKAADKLKTRYIQPAEGELYYFLGLALKAQGKDEEAYRRFSQASFYYAWHSQACLQLALMESAQGNYLKALEHIRKAWTTNNNDGTIVMLYAALLRKAGRNEEAVSLVDHLLEYDPLNFAAVYEKDLLLKTSHLTSLNKNMQDPENNYHEIALHYLNAGLYQDAADLLSAITAPVNPLTCYYLAYLYSKLNMPEKSSEQLNRAGNMSVLYCFPYRPETESVLKFAMQHDNPNAAYLLGNLLYDYRPDESIQVWSNILNSGKAPAMTYRNLAFGSFYHEQDAENAILFLKKAIDMDPANPVWYAELEKYYDYRGVDPAECLEIYEKHAEQVKLNVTAPQSMVKLYNLTGKYDKAIDLLSTHHFRTWEGGRSIYWHYVDAHVLKAIQLIDQGNYRKATGLLEKALLYPENLEVGQPLNDERNALIWYYLAVATEKTGGKELSMQYYNKCMNASNSGDWPDLLYYQALALKKTGKAAEANALLDKLAATGDEMIAQSQKIPDKSPVYALTDKRDQLSGGFYLKGLSAMGKGNHDIASGLFRKSVETYRYNLWPAFFLNRLK